TNQYAFALAWDDHRGDGGEASLQAISLQARIGMVSRWDLNRHHLFQLEIAPLLGIGSAQAKLNDSNTSDSGTYFKYGFVMQGVHQFDDNWQVLYGLAWESAEAEVAWDNTTDSTITASGINFRVGTGIRW
ncbi:MAG: hypothetical protein HRU15_12925, partial [Planctomycetes bacterium]|nr:hypothetical protein [Planctomycetota bacterium]